MSKDTFIQSINELYTQLQSLESSISSLNNATKASEITLAQQVQTITDMAASLTALVSKVDSLPNYSSDIISIKSAIIDLDTRLKKLEGAVIEPPPPPPVDTTAPSVVVVTANPVSTTQIDLSWTPATDNVGVVGYNIFRNGALIATISELVFSDKQLTASTSYQYLVNALDAVGNSSSSLPVTVKTLDPVVVPPPEPPSSVLVTKLAKDFATKSIGGVVSPSSWNIWSNGYISDTVNITTAGTYTLEVWAYGQQAGPALVKMSVEVVGVNKQTIDVPNTTTAAFKFDFSLPVGSNIYKIYFDNDYQSTNPTTDRNLVVDKLVITYKSDVVVEPPPVEPPLPPPTLPPTTRDYSVGQHRLGMSKPQLALWQQMKTANHPMYQRLKSDADNTGLYEDYGHRDGLMYLLTGDKAYAERAFAHQPKHNPDRNGTRHMFTSSAILFDWIKDGLSAANKTTFKNVLTNWTNLVLGISSTTHGTRFSDSDEQTGHYFGLAIFALSIKDEDPTLYNTIVNFTGTATAGKFGGFDYTGKADWSSMREMITTFMNIAKGGQWIESTKYNMGTTAYLFAGAEAINYYFKTDKFPDVTSEYDNFAKAAVQQIAPTLWDSYQWGDNEQARDLNLWSRVPNVGIIAGITKNKQALWLFDKLYTNYGTSTNFTSGYFWPFVDPYSTREIPTGVSYHGSTGVGVCVHHSGWNTSDSFFGSEIASKRSVDHDNAGFANFQLFRKGGWAVTNPIFYYGNSINHAPYLNTLLVSGDLPIVQAEAKKTTGYEAGSDYLYHVGTTGGQMVYDNYYNPPAETLHEWTRTNFLFRKNGEDFVILFDRVNADDPLTTNYTRLPATSVTRIQASGAKHIFVMNTVGTPIINGNKFSWTAVNGEKVYWQTFIPTFTSAIQDLAVSNFGGYTQASELKTQLRLTITDKTSFQTLLNVVHVPGDFMATELNSSTGAKVRGVNVANTAVLFFADKVTPPAPTPKNGDRAVIDYNRIEKLKNLHFNSLGFTVDIGNATQAFICDLNPAKIWTVNNLPVEVSAQGVARVNATGLITVKSF